MRPDTTGPAISAIASPNAPDLSVVVVNYNAGPALEECLADLAAAAPAGGLEVLVVDNASRDGSLDQARRRHPWARFIASPVNRGFAAGCNLGLAAATGRHLMLLNPDTRLAPGCLEAMCRFLDTHPRAGALGPRVLDPDGRVQLSARGAPGPGAFLFHRYSLLTRLFPGNALSRRYLHSDWDHATTREVDWLSGAALMLSRPALAAAGPLDEGFFLFHEDVDLCLRVRQAGFTVVYHPGATVIHAIGISKEKADLRLLKARHRSMMRFVRKHHRRWGPLLWLADLAIAWRFGLLAAAAAFRKLR